LPFNLLVFISIQCYANCRVSMLLLLLIRHIWLHHQYMLKYTLLPLTDMFYNSLCSYGPVFNATFNNMSVICGSQFYWWRKTGEHHWPATSHWQTLSHNVSNTPPHDKDLNDTFDYTISTCSSTLCYHWQICSTTPYVAMGRCGLDLMVVRFTTTCAISPNPKLIEIDISSNGQNFKILWLIWNINCSYIRELWCLMPLSTIC
jgi:hypothetical protein